MLQHKIARRCRTPFPQAQLKCSGTTLCTTQFSSAFVLKGMCVASRKISRGATPSRMGYFPVQSARFASISRPHHGSNGSAGGKRHTVSHGIPTAATVWSRAVAHTQVLEAKRTGPDERGWGGFKGMDTFRVPRLCTHSP